MPNRYICDVLSEMHKAHESHNYSYLPGLIEEAQSIVNRMEAKLYDLKDHERLLKDVKKLREDVEELREVKESLSGNNNDSDHQQHNIRDIRQILD